MELGRPTLPEPPPAVIEMHAIEERWGQFADWLDEASRALSLYRPEAHRLVFKSIDVAKRTSTLLKIQDVYFDRMRQLDEAEEAFRRAYHDARRALDWAEIGAYAEAIEPLMREFRKQSRVRAAEEMAERMLQRADEKHAIFEGRRERRQARDGVRNRVGSGMEVVGDGEVFGSGRDRDVPEADRSAEAADEGTGD